MWCEIRFVREVESAWRMASSRRQVSLHTQQFRSAFIVNQNIPKLDYYHCLAICRHVSLTWIDVPWPIGPANFQ